MTVPVPTPLPTTSGWSAVDWLDKYYWSDPAAADGTAQIQLPALPDTDRWQLTHMVAGCTSSGASQMRLYLNSVANENLRDGTSAGNFDVADWAQGLWIPPGQQLIAAWTSCDPGSVATLTLQAVIYRQSS